MQERGRAVVAREAHNLKVNGSNPFLVIFFNGEMAERLKASDLKSEKLKKFREFKSHSLLLKSVVKLIIRTTIKKIELNRI